MNVDTGAWQALNAKVKEQRKETTLLIRAMAILMARQPEAQDPAPERPHLLVIKGGKRS